MAKVLIVDDNAVDRAVLRRMLETFGHSVVEASDGLEVDDKIIATAPDIILLDILMPGQEGIATLLEVKAQFLNLPIIAISGADEPMYLEMIQALGADYGFRKPPDEEKLNSKIAELTASVCPIEPLNGHP
jgi:CheY-like chemotaxis protein